MKHLLVAAVAALALAAGSADAAHFTPYNTAFTWTGTLQFQAKNGGKFFHCPYTFRGMTGGKADGGGMTITGATFCPKVMATQLPWAGQAVQHEGADGYVTMSISIKGLPCGSQIVGFGLRNGVTFGAGTFPSGCFFGGGFGTSTPKIGVRN